MLSMAIEVPEESEFYRAETIKEATELLAERDAAVISGGQSLMPLIRQGMIDKNVIVDISNIDGYDDARIDDDGLHLGGLMTHRELIESEAAESQWSVLTEAAKEIGDRQVRNWGTVGGAVAHADPTLDYPPAMTVLDARVLVTGDGETTEEIPIDELYLGPFVTQLTPEQLVVGVRLPPLPENSGAAFEKHSIRKGDQALVNLAVRLSADDDGTVASARICFGSVVPEPTRLRELEDELVGTDLDDREAQEAVADAVGEYIEPVPEAHASASYQTRLAENMAVDALRTASNRALEVTQ